MKQCHHRQCDDVSKIDQGNILFLGKVTDSLVQTMMNLSSTDNTVNPDPSPCEF